jgi:flagellar biosynthesis/type III secretory pathway protein FliH
MRALEELKMLARTDLERERYEARRKAQLDYNTGLKVARLEGRQEGIQEGRQEGIQEGRQEGIQEGQTKGEKIGIIHLCESLLNRPETATAQLAALSIEALARLADDLQSQVLKQRRS